VQCESIATRIHAVKRNKGVLGIDGVTIEDFEQQLNQRASPIIRGTEKLGLSTLAG